MIQLQFFFSYFFLALIALLFASRGLNAQELAETVFLQQLNGSSIIRAVVKASNASTLSAQISGQVLDIKYREGEVFPKDNILILLDCTQIQAKVASAQARLLSAHIHHQSAQRMFELGSIGESKVNLTHTDVLKAEAELAISSYDERHCNIRAPFDGKVLTRKIGLHEYVTPGKELMKILDTRDLELELLIPSTWLRWIQPGVTFSVKLDATDLSYDGKIVRIGAEVDPSSQSVEVYGIFIKAPDGVLSGMSGNVTFPILENLE